MKLYYSPGSCALTVHTLLNDITEPFELEKINLKNHKTESGEDFYQINPKGYVPVLELDTGERLTELPAIVQYLVETTHNHKLFPAEGLAKFQVIEWLGFISSEIHKSFAPLFDPTSSDDMKKLAVARISRRFAYINDVLNELAYVSSDQLSIADIYLYVILTWAKNLNIDISPWENLQALKRKVRDYPALQKSMREEGLI